VKETAEQTQVARLTRAGGAENSLSNGSRIHILSGVHQTLDMTPKSLLTVSSAILIFAAIFGVLNSFRVSGLQTNLARAATAHDAVEQHGAPVNQQTKPAGTGVSAAAVFRTSDDKSAAKAEADLAQVLKEKSDLQTKLKATEAELASVHNQSQESGGEGVTINPGAPSATELQAQLDDTRRQLENAERENSLLSEKLGGTPKYAASETTAAARGRYSAATSRPEVKTREASPVKAGLRATVMAANQAYNFVVLNVGERQGLRSNQHMLVLRDGVLIGKIRISSVEPATAIGDIVTNSLARGVQVQPGDVVIYADTNR
jgi:hypothetical protein